MALPKKGALCATTQVATENQTLEERMEVFNAGLDNAETWLKANKSSPVIQKEISRVLSSKAFKSRERPKMPTYKSGKGTEYQKARKDAQLRRDVAKRLRRLVTE